MISQNLYNLALLFHISNGPIFHISNGPILKYTSDQTADSPPPPPPNFFRKKGLTLLLAKSYPLF